MNMLLQPWHIAFIAVTGWLNRQQREAFDYLRTENEVLREKNSLRNAAREYVAHNHAERNHQGLNNRRIEEPPKEDSNSGDVIEGQRLGGLLRHYRRAVA